MSAAPKKKRVKAIWSTDEETRFGHQFIEFISSSGRRRRFSRKQGGAAIKRMEGQWQCSDCRNKKSQVKFKDVLADLTIPCSSIGKDGYWARDPEELESAHFCGDDTLPSVALKTGQLEGVVTEHQEILERQGDCFTQVLQRLECLESGTKWEPDNGEEVLESAAAGRGLVPEAIPKKPKGTRKKKPAPSQLPSKTLSGGAAYAGDDEDEEKQQGTSSRAKRGRKRQRLPTREERDDDDTDGAKKGKKASDNNGYEAEGTSSCSVVVSGKERRRADNAALRAAERAAKTGEEESESSEGKEDDSDDDEHKDRSDDKAPEKGTGGAAESGATDAMDTATDTMEEDPFAGEPDMDDDQEVEELVKHSGEANDKVKEVTDGAKDSSGSSVMGEQSDQSAILERTKGNDSTFTPTLFSSVQKRATADFESSSDNTTRSLGDLLDSPSPPKEAAPKPGLAVSSSGAKPKQQSSLKEAAPKPGVAVVSSPGAKPKQKSSRKEAAPKPVLAVVSSSGATPTQQSSLMEAAPKPGLAVVSSSSVQPKQSKAPKKVTVADSPISSSAHKSTKPKVAPFSAGSSPAIEVLKDESDSDDLHILDETDEREKASPVVDDPRPSWKDDTKEADLSVAVGDRSAILSAEELSFIKDTFKTPEAVAVAAVFKMYKFSELMGLRVAMMANTAKEQLHWVVVTLFENANWARCLQAIDKRLIEVEKHVDNSGGFKKTEYGITLT